MASHSSASKRETPYATLNINSKSETNISDALRRRALSFINNRSIEPQSRAVIQYALETNDPWLPELIRRVDAGETVVEALSGPTLQTNEEKIETLAELICRAGDEPETKSAALLVLMATLENAPHPKALANTAKHFAFTRCGELNVDNMVDVRVAALEDEILAMVR